MYMDAHGLSLSRSMPQTAKVHPSSASTPQTTSSPMHERSKREFFTIWMKSLVLNGNGCTVYNSKGQIAYRVDNYDSKCCSKVYLMDLQGHVLLKILKKKLRVLGRWEGYRCGGLQEEETKPWFKVHRPCGIFNAEHPICKVWGESGSLGIYEIDEFMDSAYKIVDISDHKTVLAEVRRKHTASGIALGEDVFTLVIEPSIDHSLIMGLVIVYGLMNHNL